MNDIRLAELVELLRSRGGGVPRLLIDLDALDRNIDRLLAMHAAETIRIVVKSLPSPGLLRHVSDRTGHRRFMAFHLPFLLQVVEIFPEADVLMGKPLPLDAMRRFYRERRDNTFDDTRQLQWLVDTPQRLRQVAELGREIGRRIAISIELDIGMHRGGIATADELGRLLTDAREQSDVVRVSGFMGYDAHVPKAPWPRSVDAASRQAMARYSAGIELARSEFGELEESPWCLNGAGSPTIALHGDHSPTNDLSIGSALVKPVSFDLPTLSEFEAAAWIAAPVLKRLEGVKIPFLERLPSRGRDALFIYGGRWMAEPAWPAGLRENPTYGRSSNQQQLTVPSDCRVAVDDYVVLRPTQSEAVLLQFGDLVAVRGTGIEGNWPTFRNSDYPAGG